MSKYLSALNTNAMRVVMGTLSAGLMLPVFGASHVWTNNSSANPKFSEKSNWQGGTAAPDVLNKASQDPKYYDGADVDFSQVTLDASAKPQTITLPGSSNGFMLFGKLSSNPYQFLNVDYSQNGGTGSGTDAIWVNDGADFKGLITCNPAGGSGKHTVQTLVALFNNTVLPLADGRHNMGYYTHYYNSSTIGQFAGAGVVVLGSANYVGQGTTTISYPSGPETSFYTRCGVYVLNGFTAEPALIGGSVLHFDASDVSTLTVSGGRVMAWRDKSGGGITATTYPQVTLAAPCEFPGTYAPSDVSFVKDVVTRLPVVSFGAPFGNRNGYRNLVALRGEDLGAPGALKLSSPVSGVKEVFYVFRDLIAKGYQMEASASFVVGTDSGHASLNPFGRLISDNRFVDDLFASTGSSAMMKTSAVFCDGQRLIPETSYTFNDYSRRLHVVSCGLSDGEGTIETLGFGSDANGNIFYGGVAIAEVIAYNRSLTPEERHQVQSYLRAKWQPEVGPAWDYGSLWLVENGSNAVDFRIDSGVTAIRDLRPITSALTKDGNGTLVIGRLHGFDEYTIDVKGGAVRFETPALPVEERAADPLVWFDATQVSEDKLLHQDGKTYVTELVDPRPSGKNHHDVTVKAVRHSQIYYQTGKLGAYATLQSDALNGKPVFNFGEFYAQHAQSGWGWDVTKSSAAPYMITMNDARYVDNMREGFAVVRIRPNSDTDIVDVFGGNANDGYEIFGGTRKALIGAAYTSAISKSGLWRVNGEIVDPTTYARNSSDFYLVSVSLPRPLTCNTIAIDRNAYTAGGMDIAEILVYDRQLTDAERVNTEAYLMKKWLNSEHPYAKPLKVKVNALSDPERLTQGGKGSLNISGVSISRLTGVDVKGGSLKWEFSGADLFLKSRVHLDAMVESSLTTTGGNWVTSWSDVRGNGVAALADRGASADVADTAIIRPGVSPTLTTATIGGGVKNVIDFGDFTDGKDKDASGMRITVSGAPATSAAMRINIGNADVDKGVEFYVVHADAHNQKDARIGVMGIQENGTDYTIGGVKYTNTYPFLRNGKKLLWGGFTKAVSRGTILVDAEVQNEDYEIAGDDQFHLYTFYPEVPVLARGFAMRTTYERGGQKLGEVAIFSTVNTPAMRDRINAYLLKKWFGKGNGFTLSLNDITLAYGGTFDFATTDDTAISVKSIVADGIVKAPAIAVTKDFTFKVLADERGRGTGVTSLTVDGQLTLPESGTIKIELPVGFKRIKGKFPLITASELVGGIAGLTLVCDVGDPAIAPKLSLEGNTVFAEFMGYGMSIIIR